MATKAKEKTTIFSLEDGRRLAYSEYGPSSGKPVIFMHGTPGSRHFHIPKWLEPSLKLRIIVPDRPGMGLSDPLPGRRLLDWPHDVRELADHLGLSTFSVAGISGGGPHALATAYALPDRIDTAVVISGAAPFDDFAGAIEGMHRGNRIVFTLADRAPLALEMIMAPNIWLNRKLQRFFAAKLPEKFAKAAQKGLPEADRDVLSDPVVAAAFMAGSQESTRQGARGIVQEATIFIKPWGFSLSEIKVPVHLWQGDQDKNVPVAMGERMAAEIPNAKLHQCPGEGHLLVIKHWPEIEEVLAAND